ncbi:MAG: hypothetical protein CMI26_03850 [Opitutae bacterium]|nr:hypothetical protein [Opitutae bacterium]
MKITLIRYAIVSGFLFIFGLSSGCVNQSGDDVNQANDNDYQSGDDVNQSGEDRYQSGEEDANSTNSAENKGMSEKEWKSVFDGKTLGDWKVTDYAGKGEVSFDENGSLVLGMGIELTGVHLPGGGDYPNIDYEIALQAKREQGGDFFCGLTFPYSDSNATLILGGWGGALVGISSIDDFDASENETGDVYVFEENRWYDVRLRVTEAKLEAWIDDKKIIDCEVGNRKISMRSGEVELAAPLGLCSYATTGVIRKMRIRKLTH